MIFKIILKKFICSSLKYGLFSWILVNGFGTQAAESADINKTPQENKEITTFIKTDSDTPNLDNQ